MFFICNLAFVLEVYVVAEANVIKWGTGTVIHLMIDKNAQSIFLFKIWSWFRRDSSNPLIWTKRDLACNTLTFPQSAWKPISEDHYFTISGERWTRTPLQGTALSGS